VDLDKYRGLTEMVKKIAEEERRKVEQFESEFGKVAVVLGAESVFLGESVAEVKVGLKEFAELVLALAGASGRRPVVFKVVDTSTVRYYVFPMPSMCVFTVLHL